MPGITGNCRRIFVHYAKRPIGLPFPSGEIRLVCPNSAFNYREEEEGACPKFFLLSPKNNRREEERSN